MILAALDLQVCLMLSTKFQANAPLGSEEETKNRFSRWQPAILDFQSEDFSNF